MNPDQPSIRSGPAACRFRYTSDSKPLDGYTIKRGIGIGGFGEVYFAISDAGKEVALKRIQRNLDVELRGVQNCLNLKHANLISLWDIRTDQVGDSWVVMEYVPGPSLREIVEVHGRGMPGHQIERWFDPIATGVNYLHDSGLVHRDLKPANIFLDEDENVIKIGDYGLSKFISSSQGSGQTETVGTFHYMAPEIGKGIYGKGIDIYAMGIVLYEMLTGNVPFQGESSQEIIMKHLTTDPDLSKIPFDFREAIRRSLLKDPEERFGSISELRACLPWSNENEYSKTALNSARFSVGSDDQALVNDANVSRGHPEVMRDVFEQNGMDDGILFGPLRDSSVGSRLQETVHYIEDANRPAHPTKPSHRENEPIAAAIKTGWGGIADWWFDTSVSTPLKVFVLLVSGIAITANSQWLLPVALGIGFLYLVYFGVRNLLLLPAESDLQPKKLSKRRQRQLIQQGMREKLARSDFVHRTTALTGSLLTAAAVCVALNLLGLAITDSVFDSAINSWALFTWSTIVSILGSWALLVLGKIYEPSDGDWFQRRFAMLVVGILIGGVALLTSSYFNVNFEDVAATGFNPLVSTQFAYTGSNPLLVNVLFFAGVFGLLRWWRQVDPTRRTRLSILGVGLCLVWAALFSHILNFAPLLNCMLVVVISIAIQLSSPWISSEERQSLLISKST